MSDSLTLIVCTVCDEEFVDEPMITDNDSYFHDVCFAQYVNEKFTQLVENSLDDKEIIEFMENYNLGYYVDYYEFDKVTKLSYDQKKNIMGFILLSIIKNDNEQKALDFLDEFHFNDYMDQNHCNVFWHACNKKMEKLALRLLAIPGINYNCVEKIFGGNSFWCACTSHRQNVILKMLETPGIDYNALTMDGYDSFSYVCYTGQKNIALKMLENKSIDCSRVHPNGSTALIGALRSGMEDVALKIMERQSTGINYYKSDAYFFAKKNKMKKVLKVLKKHKKSKCMNCFLALLPCIN